MNPQHPVDPGHTYCSKCKRQHLEEAFFRRGKTWKTCNVCSAHQASKRHTETLRAVANYDIFQQSLAGLQVSPQQYNSLMLRQQEFDHQQQVQFEQHWRQQRDPRKTLEHLLGDSTIYELSPMERFIHDLQLNNQSIGPPISESLQFWDLEPMVYDNPQPQPNERMSITGPLQMDRGMDQDPFQGVDQDMLPEYGPLDLFDCNPVKAANRPLVIHSWFEANPLPSDLQPHADDVDIGIRVETTLRAAIDQMDHEEEVLLQSMLTEVGSDNHDMNYGGRADSLILESLDAQGSLSQPFTDAPDVMGVSMEGADPQSAPMGMVPSGIYLTQQAAAAAPTAHAKAPAHPVRQESASLDLQAYFKDFNPSEDILCQAPPNHDLTGEALLEHHIRELGLAIRLSKLTVHWQSMKQFEWYKGVDTVARLEENGDIQAWGPLSDWLVIYQNGLEDIAENLDSDEQVNHQMVYKTRAARFVHYKSMKASLRVESQRLFQENKETLLKLFVELTGQTEYMVKIVLGKQVRLMQAAIAQDCRNNGILNLTP